MPPLKDDLMNSAASSAGDISAKLGQSSLISNSCVLMALACGLAGLTVGGLVLGAVLYKCRRDNADLKRRNTSLQNKLQRKEEEQDDMVQVVTTLKEVKTKLEEQRDRLKGKLEEVEAEKEENKKKLQSVETEITEREMTFDKPEELLREKENLLQAQWKLDHTKKNCERQILNIEKSLEPIEIQVTRINRKRDVQIWLD